MLFYSYYFYVHKKLIDNEKNAPICCGPDTAVYSV